MADLCDDCEKTITAEYHGAVESVLAGHTTTQMQELLHRVIKAVYPTANEEMERSSADLLEELCDVLSDFSPDALCPGLAERAACTHLEE